MSEAYNDFLDAVARNRGISASDVRSGYGEGRMLNARHAVQAGMADRIGTLEETINRLLENGAAPATRQVGQVYKVVTGSSAVSTQPQEPTDPDGQEPAADESQTGDGTQARLSSLARRLELAENSFHFSGESIMNIRELLKKRADDLSAARALHETADAESRDLTTEERAEFDLLLSEAEALAAQIEMIQTERARLTAAENMDLKALDEPQKPVATSDPKTLKRAEFDELSPKARAAFVKSGGKIND